MLPEFHQHRVIEWEMYVDESSSSLTTYDMIVGRDLMESIGLDLLFSENLMRWDNATVPMRDNKLFTEVKSNPYHELLSMHDPVTTEAERIQGILDIKYAPADLDKIVQDSTHLTDMEKSTLGKLTVPMRDNKLFTEVKSNPYHELLSMHDPVTTEAERIQGILDIKYAPADLDKIVQDSTHLTDMEKSTLGKLMAKYQDLFDGTLGTWKTDPIELGTSPRCQSRTMPSPTQFHHSQEKKLKAEEIDRMCSYGVLRKVNRSEWGFPAFIYP